MQEQVVVTGIVIKQSPVGESDRRIVLLTNSRGKITVFARGARKPNSRFAATTGMFCFGSFRLYEGRDAYNLADCEISNYFDALRQDVEGSCYAAYFAEIVDYYCVENNDERDMMKLLYQSLRALSSSIPNKLIRVIYELKSIVINGEYPGVPADENLSESCKYAMNYIAATGVEKLYTFNVSENTLVELEKISKKYCRRYMNHRFNSLDILEAMV